MASTLRPEAVRHVLPIVLVGAFLGQFETFVVNVAAPSIQASLGLSNIELELVVAGYAFAFAASLVTGGRLGDMYGYRRLYLWGLVAFAATSTLCGVATSGVILIAARFAQGLAAGVLIPQVLASINAYLSGQARLAAMGWYGAATGIGSIVGQFAGGALVSWNVFGWGWRTVFFIAVPICLVTLAAGLAGLPREAERVRRAFDVPGTLGMALSIGLVTGAVIASSLVPLGWVFGTVAAGVVIGAVTLVHERGLLRVGGDPAVDVSLFRAPSLRRGLVGVALFMTYFSSFMYLLTNVLQRGLGLGALAAGLVFVPSGVTFAGTSILFRNWSARHQVRSITIGTTITSLGLVVAAAGEFAARTAEPGRTVACLVVAVILTGTGNGLTLPVLIGYALTDVPAERAGVGSAMVNSVQQFASVFGIAIFGSVFYALSGGAAGGPVRAMGWCLVVYVGLLAAVTAVVRGRK